MNCRSSAAQPAYCTLGIMSVVPMWKVLDVQFILESGNKESMTMISSAEIQRQTNSENSK